MSKNVSVTSGALALAGRLQAASNRVLPNTQVIGREPRLCNQLAAGVHVQNVTKIQWGKGVEYERVSSAGGASEEEKGLEGRMDSMAAGVALPRGMKRAGGGGGGWGVPADMKARGLSDGC
jgi:hypothetical protein